MKKNFLSVAAMVVAFFVSTEIAKAADVTFSGQIRTRWDATEQFGGSVNDPAGDNQTDDAVFSSVRLAAKANVNDTTSAFIQLQSTRNWGNAPASANAVASGAGEGNASNSVNDNDSSVGVHQAYMEFKNFLNLPMGFNAKIGRQEVLLDGWRLFGNTIWTPGMQSHDMVRLEHKHDNTYITLGYILEQEGDRESDAGDRRDNDTYMAYLNQKGVLGGQLSLYYVFMNQQGMNLDRGVYFSTIGGRQAGKLAGFDYRVEAYYQVGDAEGINNGSVTANRVANGVDVDFDAYMFGVRVGRTATSMASKPSITFWYDYLSGTNDKDGRDGNWSSFDTIYDTGHKYYGLIDLFLGIGGGGAGGTQGLGLQDLAIKGKIKPMAGWTLKADYHWFYTAESVAANSVTHGVAGIDGSYGNSLGTELDITAVTKMNANAKVMIGYSNYNSSRSFRALKGTTGANGVLAEDMNWGYVQLDVKF